MRLEQELEELNKINICMNNTNVNSSGKNENLLAYRSKKLVNTK